MSTSTNNLVGEFDAQIWAKTWLEVISENPNIPTDEGTMIGWFSNALMTGYDQGQRAEHQRDIVEKIREIIFQSVGAATGVILVDHPHYVFPSERVKEAVEKVCAEFGIPKVEGY